MCTYHVLPKPDKLSEKIHIFGGFFKNSADPNFDAIIVLMQSLWVK